MRDLLFTPRTATDALDALRPAVREMRRLARAMGRMRAAAGSPEEPVRGPYFRLLLRLGHADEKGLSTGEKQMYVKAKKILASELMYAKDLSEDDAHAWLEDVLANPAKPARKSRAKTAETAAATA